MSDNNKNQSPPRHWHGVFGDRYEHENVWVRGGPVHPTTTPVWAIRPAGTEDRRDSGGSDSSVSSPNDTTIPHISDKRRASGHLFEGLTHQKRDEGDPNLAARRNSWKEQKEQGGFFSKMWDSYTKGK